MIKQVGHLSEGERVPDPTRTNELDEPLLLQVEEEACPLLPWE